MAIPGLFKVPKNKEFKFIPRYYDERKEKLQERIRTIEAEMGIKSNKVKYHSGITRGSMRGNRDRVRSAKKQSNIRLLVILGFLVILIYFIFFR
jgi:2'-5' RNA ligase